MILFFWTTWCHHSKEALTTIQDDYYEDWQEEYGLKLVGISIDDARNAVKVGPFASGLGWEYEIYLDENADLKRAMGVNNAPHVFIVDGDRNIVWQQEVFNSGDEEVLDEQLSNLVGKKK